jgi:uncharacterized membrane protein YsdA (DUF1294 family)/cold shock CspA family protein
MKQERGTLIHWDDDKGYGFLRSNDGKKETFLHIRSLPHYQRRPQIGDVLKYEVEVDEKERPIASSAKIKGLAWSYFTFSWVFLSLLFGTYMYLAFRQILPFYPVFSIYAAVSLLTIWVYSCDKHAAQRGLRRTPEKRLHLLEALGGWPGALFAQILYRPKDKRCVIRLFFGSLSQVMGLCGILCWPIMGGISLIRRLPRKSFKHSLIASEEKLYTSWNQRSRKPYRLRKCRQPRLGREPALILRSVQL